MAGVATGGQVLSSRKEQVSMYLACPSVKSLDVVMFLSIVFDSLRLFIKLERIFGECHTLSLT